jgi:hypothetical protein
MGNKMLAIPSFLFIPAIVTTPKTLPMKKAPTPRIVNIVNKINMIGRSTP